MSRAYKPTPEEQETILAFDRSSATASIYCADPVMMRKLDAMTRKTPLIHEVKRDASGRWYECAKSMIKVQKPRKLSEEEREKRANRMRNRNTTQGSVNE